MLDSRPYRQNHVNGCPEGPPSAGLECVIIGVGHPQRGDDAAGIAAVAELRLRGLPDLIEAAEIGTDGFALILQMKRARRAVILDAVAMDRPPGTIRAFGAEEITRLPSTRPLSVHSFDLAQMLKMAAMLGIAPEIRLLGIQPQAMELGAPLSSPVRAAIPRLADIALRCATGTRA